MAYAQHGPFIAEKAGADLSTSQYRAVTLNAANRVVLVGAAARIIGILQNDPLNNEQATIQHRDVSKAVAGGAFNPGDNLTTDAAGRLVAAAVGNPIVAKALSAGALGRIVSVLIQPGAGVA